MYTILTYFLNCLCSDPEIAKLGKLNPNHYGTPLLRVAEKCRRFVHCSENREKTFNPQSVIFIVQVRIVF